MPRRPTLQDVEVVDDQPDDGTPPPPATDEAPPARRRWPLVLAAAVLAVLVAAGVTGQVVLDRRERARLAAVTVHPAAVPLLDEPPVPLWEVDSGDLVEAAQVTTPDGLLVGLRGAVEGPVAVAALDAATGREVWRVDLVDGSTRPAAAPGSEVYPDSGSCTAHGTQPHLAVCLAHDGAYAIGVQSARLVLPSTSRVVVLDTRDGGVVTDLTGTLVPDGVATSAAVVGDLVVAVVEAAGGVTVRAATTDGTAQWSTTVATTEHAAPGDTRVERVGDLVAVLGETDVTLLDREGGTVRTHPLAGGYPFVTNGTVYVMSPADGPDAPTTLVRPEGVVQVEGDVMLPFVDDGSAPGLVLTTDDEQVSGWVDGERRWTTDRAGQWNVLVLGGQVFLDQGRSLVALDPRDGTELWTSDAVRGLPVTDGRVLLGVARSADRGAPAQMVALDPEDGSELWRAPLPDRTVELWVHERVLTAVRESVQGDGPLTVLG